MKLNKPYNNKQYAKLAIYCNENNLKIKDKGDYLESVSIVYMLEELKEQKLSEAKIKVEQAIFDKYPQTKQNNIAISGTDEERQEFKEFKLSKTNIYDEIIELISSAETIEALNDIIINFED